MIAGMNRCTHMRLVICLHFVTVCCDTAATLLQICGGDWAKHSTETGGYFRCNMTAPPEDESLPSADSAAGFASEADSAHDGASSQQLAAAGQVAGTGAGLLGSLYGKFANAGAKWKLDFFTRRFLAHECSHRQLQVARAPLWHDIYNHLSSTLGTKCLS